MFRNPDRMEGGPGDPKDVAEWWKHFRVLAKNVLLPLGIFFAVILAISALGSGLMSILR